MENSILVPENYEEGNPTLGSKQQGLGSPRNYTTTSNGTQAEVVRAALLVGRSGSTGLSTTATSLIAQSTRTQTKVKYGSMENKWRQYCSQHGYDTKATTETLLNFLADEFQRGLKYTYLRGYTAALAKFTQDVDHNALSSLLKGIYT